MWQLYPENCQNQNLHTSKIRTLRPFFLRNNTDHVDHISMLDAKFDANRLKIADMNALIQQYTNWN